MLEKAANNHHLITIGYAEDHILVRKGIIECINAFAGCTVTIQAGNGKELLQEIESQAHLPDICILDMFMPVLNGLETLVSIKKQWPEIKVLILSGNNSEYYVPRLLYAGAGGYLLKDCEPSELEAAIRSIYANGFYTPDLNAYKFYRAVVKSEKALPQLNQKEIEVLELCCSDLSYAEIAKILGTTPHSVDWFRNSLFKKLHVKSRSTLVLYAIQFGLVHLDIDFTRRSISPPDR